MLKAICCLLMIHVMDDYQIILSGVCLLSIDSIFLLGIRKVHEKKWSKTRQILVSIEGFAGYNHPMTFDKHDHLGSPNNSHVQRKMIYTFYPSFLQDIASSDYPCNHSCSRMKGQHHRKNANNNFY